MIWLSSLQSNRQMTIRTSFLQCDQEDREHLLEISQECLLCYDQSQQRSGHANWPQNHKLVNVLPCGLVFSHLIGFSLARQ